MKPRKVGSRCTLRSTLFQRYPRQTLNARGGHVAIEFQSSRDCGCHRGGEAMKTITVTIRDEEYERLATFAKRTNRSMADTISLWIRQKIDCLAH